MFRRQNTIVNINNKRHVNKFNETKEKEKKIIKLLEVW